MVFSVRLLVAIGSLAAAAGVASADTYGAIAYSPATGASGYSYDYDSEYGAVSAAKQSCGASDCEDVIVFWNGACGALAVGQGGGWGASAGYGQGDAESGALRICSQYTRQCRVEVWACTSEW